MKKVEDLLSSAKTVHDRYSLGRMERETVREWVLGLSTYPEPHGTRIQDAASWFRPIRNDADPTELKITDLAKLHSIYQP